MRKDSRPFGTPSEYSSHLLKLGPLHALLYHVTDSQRTLVASCCRERFDAISVLAADDFNKRLKKASLPSGKWGRDETAIERIFGRELTLLLLAVGSDLAQSKCPTYAAAYWLALRPEERWWLLQQAQNSEASKGWEVALAFIFYNMPLSAATVTEEAAAD